MATKVKHIVGIKGFRKMTDVDLIARATTIANQMTGNANYPTPPVDPNTLKTTIADFSTAVAAALGGGVSQTAEKDKVKDRLVHMLSQLVAYVEATAGTDLAIFTSSGFQAKPPKTPAQPLTQPIIDRFSYGVTDRKSVV